MNIEKLNNYLEGRFKVKSETNIKIMNYVIHLASTGVYRDWWVISLSSVCGGGDSLVFHTHKNTILDVEDIIYKMVMEGLDEYDQMMFERYRPRRVATNTDSLTDDGCIVINNFISDVMHHWQVPTQPKLDSNIRDEEGDTSNQDNGHDESIFRMTDPNL